MYTARMSATIWQYLGVVAPKTFGVVGRLAPSPTGLLHLGNAWAFLLAWLAARHACGNVILRMEDIDPDRSRATWAQNIVRDLQWLGITWDYGPDVGGPHAPYTQSQRMELYKKALRFLDAKGCCYPCYCTRKELRQLAGAPHADDIGAPYPGTCRTLTAEQRQEKAQAGRAAAIRVRCPEGSADSGRVPLQWIFDDVLCGRQCRTLAECGGDFALRRSDGVIAYQLAVVVDDALMGVTQVVRGRDILVSTPRQMFLAQLLGFPVPQYAHVPLLCDAAGERLAKRHDSLSLQYLRAAGVAPQAVVGLLACLAGLQPDTQPCTPQDLVATFDWTKIPAQAQVCVTPAMLDSLHTR